MQKYGDVSPAQLAVPMMPARIATVASAPAASAAVAAAAVPSSTPVASGSPSTVAKVCAAFVHVLILSPLWTSLGPLPLSWSLSLWCPLSLLPLTSLSLSLMLCIRAWAAAFLDGRRITPRRRSDVALPQRRLRPQTREAPPDAAPTPLLLTVETPPRPPVRAAAVRRRWQRGMHTLVVSHSTRCKAPLTRVTEAEIVIACGRVHRGVPWCVSQRCGGGCAIAHGRRSQA